MFRGKIEICFSTLLRKETICTGNSTPLGSFGTNATDSEWVVLDIDTWTNLGSHVANCGGGDIPSQGTAYADKYKVSGTSLTLNNLGSFTKQ